MTQGTQEGLLAWRDTPGSCNPSRYECDPDGYALHVSRVHGTVVPDELFNTSDQESWERINRLHERAMRRRFPDKCRLQYVGRIFNGKWYQFRCRKSHKHVTPIKVTGWFIMPIDDVWKVKVDA